MNQTDTLIGSAARKRILAGVNAVFNAIRPSLGPAGKSAILPRTFNRGSRHADDGYFIAENVIPKNEHERQAALSFKESIKRTNQLAGDGTTGTGVISGTLINEIVTPMLSDVPVASVTGISKSSRTVRQIRQELKQAKEQVIEHIKEHAKPIKTLADLERIALVSIGKEDEATAKLVANMVWEVGRDASGAFLDNYIEVTEGYKGGIETEVVRGMRFPAKVAHRAFVTRPERFEMEGTDIAVFITNYKLDNPYQIIDILNKIRPPKIAIFAPEFSPGTIKSLIETTKNGLFCYPVKCPALRTEQMEDLAIYTGATLIDKDTGKKLENVQASDLGFAEKIIVKDTENREDMIVLGGKGEKTKRGDSNLIAERQDVLRKQLKESRNEYTTGSIEKRIANLSSAVGVIRVGASTDNETLYLKLKIEDGVNSCKAALQEGYVKGGGLCLKEIAEKLPESILTSALKAPYQTIQDNAGGNLEIGKDIIDSAKVIRLQVEHAVEVASIIITTEVSIAQLDDKSPAEGYEAIAKAIKQYAFYWAKREGLLKGSEDEVENDHNREFERVLANDKD